ncbi:MAG: ammonium transporter [Phycisphaerales bacterium]|nr:ammonium transporter [Phycisphaerales bacterium]
MIANTFSTINHVNSGDVAWILTATALVLLMTLGIGFYYGGLVQRKNASSIILQSLLIMCLIGTIWPILAYSLAFSPSILGGLTGGFDYVMLRDVWEKSTSSIPGLLDMAFKCTFAMVAASLVIGGFAERMRLSAFILFVPAWILLVYCPIAHWLWGNHPGDEGFFALKNAGTLDFAGGMVVHLNAGIAALVAGLLLGRRPGFPDHIQSGHNVNFCILGAGLIWFGWIGFNAGSGGAANTVAVYALINTIFAASTAGLTWILMDKVLLGRVSGIGLISGVVSGLVAITPASGFVEPAAALAIGALASVVSFIAISVLKQILRVDDSLDVFAVHGVSAIWGALATGLFATLAVNPDGGDGVFYGDPSQIVKQLRGLAYVLVWSGLVTYIILKVIDLIVGIQPNQKQQALGLDAAQFAMIERPPIHLLQKFRRKSKPQNDDQDRQAPR